MSQVVIDIRTFFLEVHVLHQANIPSKAAGSLNLIVVIAFKFGSDEIRGLNTLNPTLHKFSLILNGLISLQKVDGCWIQRHN